MAPTQHTTEATLDRKPKYSVKIAATGKTNTIPSDSEWNSFNCRSSYGHNIVQMESTLKARTTKASNSTMDVAVDVTGSARSSDIRLAMKADPDETEYSSSFVETTSGNDNGSGPSDAEVESRFYDDSGLVSSFYGFSSLFPIRSILILCFSRKKKLTSHWRDFIRPIMWRCKWAELKMKELQLQAAKYNREISAHDRRRYRELNQASLEELGSKSLPFIHPRHRKRTMKRRKRKRVEDGTDITTHMSTHNLFSYFESKRLDLDGTPPGDDISTAALAGQKINGQDEFGIDDDFSILVSSNGYLEQILRKIELVHSRVHKLKDQLDTVTTKNAIKFSSSENLMSLDGQASSIRSPTFSACNGGTTSAGGLYATFQHVVDYDLRDFIMPDSAMSSYGEAMPIPDIIESTVGLLSSVDVTQQQVHVGDSSEKIVDNILIHNEVSEVGHILTMNHDKSFEKHQDVGNNVEEDIFNQAPPASEANAAGKASISQEQSTLKSCLASEIHFPKNKRKRGERKASSGGWNRKIPGEPDSQ
ncbi:uncharacterized protein LOC107855703 isoform X1 [Capsicum annuum]|uniref:uncharacterized protein LOC107855703 isoform X1 n=1 Tax=Capsicum annuum TaxID=4072 RepID=UPI0007BEB2C5|nr:uncharacterized protein LOC107855703 isoform X1 [Capsicum annuum]XP_016556200.1 uncharacterized protein LOC107855703 isoform X1 [Capsicum annuum]XP_016556201.1 uncharacterized protein LOC107855703 isoform X1 [Capsicum annuum]